MAKDTTKYTVDPAQIRFWVARKVSKALDVPHPRAPGARRAECRNVCTNAEGRWQL